MNNRLPVDDDWPLEDGFDLLEQIENMQNGGQYDWVSDTLEGIHATVEETGRATPRQQEAVDNIETGGRPGDWT